MNENSEVKARKRYRCKLTGGSELNASCKTVKIANVELISNLIKELEEDKDVPILIKQYMKLGGQIHSFTVDGNFGDCLDGLIVVDLLKSPKQTLGLYMEEHLENYLNYHSHQ